MWNILVVDDDFVNRKLILGILEGQAQCDVAAGGKEAIDAFKLSLANNKVYDAILLDVAMPDVDGIEVLKQIRAFEESKGILLGHGIPIIMVTAHKTTFMNSFNEGCDDFLLKPVDGDALLKKIASKVQPKA
jgi:two-component system, chemotaxis family, chemotaxis protein CheY